MTPYGAPQGLRLSWRIEQRVGKPPLPFDGETHDMSLLDGAISSLLCRRNDKIADRAPLQLGCAFERIQDIWRHASFQARCPTG